MGSPALVAFRAKQRKQRIECEFNESGHDGGHGSTDLLMTLGAWLKSVGYTGRTDPVALHARLTGAPRGATGEEGAAHVHINRALVATLTALVEQITVLSQQIDVQLPAHADAHIFTSLPRSGTVRAARRLAERARV